MSVLGIDLGGTKLAVAEFSSTGRLLSKDVVALDGRGGKDVGKLITDAISSRIGTSPASVQSIGVSVPGIARTQDGTVWAPNIPRWQDYPLVEEIRSVVGDIPVHMDSDRACCMLGELWQGNARGCRHAIYLAVGTGIGAGIFIDGAILRGADDIAGSIGWMALDKPFQNKYIPCGCFEYYASGDGIAKLAGELLDTELQYEGVLKNHPSGKLSAHHVFDAYDRNDELAMKVFSEFIQYWGMAVANLISIFNPEKVIFGGGVFGPALRFMEPIQAEARKWAQPISMTKVAFEASALGSDSAIYGAGFLALQHLAGR